MRHQHARKELPPITGQLSLTWRMRGPGGRKRELTPERARHRGLLPF